MKNWNVRKFSRKPMQPRPRRQPHSTIEDEVSAVVVSKFKDDIVGFSQKLKNKLGSDALMYSHGGYALNALVFSNPDIKERIATEVPKTGPMAEAMKAVMKDPRDVDITVVPKTPMNCNSFQSCMSNKVVKDVAEALRDLRRVIHNRLRDMDMSGIASSLIEQVRAELKRKEINIRLEDLWLTDLSHRHVQHNKQGNKVLLVDRQRNVGKNVCNADNMPLLDLDSPPTMLRGSRSVAASSASTKCYPLRDQLNSTLNFTINFTGNDNQPVSEQADFVLCRLSLGIGFSILDGNKSQARTDYVVPVNFVDVSILRSGDNFYRKDPNRPSSFTNLQVQHKPGFLPYANLGYVLGKTIMQYGTDDNMIKNHTNNIRKLDAETLQYTRDHKKKMGLRILAIVILQICSRRSMSLLELGSSQAMVERVIREILSDLPWTPEFSEAIVKYVGELLWKMLERQSANVSASVKRSPTVAVLPKTQVNRSGKLVPLTGKSIINPMLPSIMRTGVIASMRDRVSAAKALEDMNSILNRPSARSIAIAA